MVGENKTPIGKWGWAIRAFIVALAGSILYVLDQYCVLDVGRLANVVTVLVPAVAVYTLFDQRLLERVVRVIRDVVIRVRDRSRRKNSSEATKGDTVPIVSAVQPTQPLSEPVNPSTATQPIARSKFFDNPTIRDWIVVALIPIAGVLLLLFVGERVAHWATDLWAPSRKPPEIEVQSPVIPAVTNPPSMTSPQSQTRYLVSRGDSCWAIAQRCTGDGSAHFRELGPPLNNLDVSDPKCPLREGASLVLPKSWKDGCAQR